MTNADCSGLARKGLLITAPASAQGKTTVTLGLLGALRRQGVKVVSGKSGPDYIDPAFHSAATGAPCVTLDSWAMNEAALRARLRHVQGDLLVVEGAMGLLDAASSEPPGGAGSSLRVAEVLGLGAILVLDAARMGQSVAALASGFRTWPGCSLAGVILNRVGSARHESMLRAALQDICPVLGVLPRDQDLVTPSRHLGLVQAGEHPDLQEFLCHAADVVAKGCDLSGILAAARPLGDATGDPALFTPLGQRIAVAQDRAFGFSYWHMLEDWRRQGAEIKFFSPLADEAPCADTDSVFLPGGYPELHAGVLASAGTFKAGMVAAREAGALIYGECGGYMVLGDALTDAEGHVHGMLGLLPLETSFASPKRHLGYRLLQAGAGPLSGRYRGHEFHYASTVRAAGPPLFQATDAAGGELTEMGLLHGNVMGSFAHVISPDT